MPKDNYPINEVPKLFTEAKNAYLAGDYSKAKGLFNKTLSSYPNYSLTKYYLGLTSLKLASNEEEIKDALRYFEDFKKAGQLITEVTSDMGRAFYQLGNLLSASDPDKSSGYFEQAQEYFNKAIQQNPKSFAAHHGLALLAHEVAHEKEEYKAAIELIKENLLFATDKADLSVGYFLLANTYHKYGEAFFFGDYGQCDYQQAKELFSQAEAYYAKAVINCLQSNISELILYIKSRALNYSWLANAFNKLGDYHQAQDFYSKAYLVARPDSELLTHLGSCAFKFGQYGVAARWFTKAIPVAHMEDSLLNTKNEADAWLNLAEVQNAARKYLLAKNSARTGFALKPNDEETLQGLQHQLNSAEEGINAAMAEKKGIFSTKCTPQSAEPEQPERGHIPSFNQNRL